MDPGALWDTMYDVDHDRYGDAPNAWLAETAPAHWPRPARLLVIGDGEGRNGVWLAEQGHEVVTCDLSVVGVRKALARAARRGVVVDTRRGRFPDVVPETSAFDGVVLCYVHVPAVARQAFHAAALAALRPGGTLWLEAFGPEQRGRPSGGPAGADLLFPVEHVVEELIASGAEVVLAQALETELAEGPGHQGLAAVIRIVATRA
ncbi:MAG: hypothetical protein RLZZ383_2965 [Pseudomonadota bacterium]|jgi:hypothetical protein